MNVLYITHTTDLSGANRSMLQMIKELKSNYGVNPTVVCPTIHGKKQKNIKKACEDEGINCVDTKLTIFKRPGRHTWITKLYFVLFDFLYNIILAIKLYHIKFDLVHTNSSVIDSGQFIANMKHIPHVWHLREFGLQDFNMTSCLGKKYEKKIYGNATCFIAISDAIKEAFRDVIDKSKIVRIYNGINPPDKCFFSIHNNSIIQICIVGRVEPGKNQMEALEACSLLRDEGITNFHLSIIGKSKKEYQEKLEDYITRNNLSDYIDILGQRYDINSILSKMDIGLMLSNCEAFGRVTVEYMMQNLAVIATRTGANEELIVNNQTGLLYDLGSPEQLKKSLKLLIRDKNLLNTIAKNGYTYSIENFISSKNSERVYDVYKSIYKI